MVENQNVTFEVSVITSTNMRHQSSDWNFTTKQGAIGFISRRMKKKYPNEIKYEIWKHVETSEVIKVIDNKVAIQLINNKKENTI